MRQDPLAISLPQTPVQIDHELSGIVAAHAQNPLAVKPPPVETLDTHDLNLVHQHHHQQQQHHEQQQLSDEHQQQQQLLEQQQGHNSVEILIA